MARRPPTIASLASYTCRSCRKKQSRIRTYSTATGFLPAGRAWSHPPTSATVSDQDIARLAAEPIHQLRLSDLVKYPISHSKLTTNQANKNPSRHGRPPMTSEALLSSANFTSSLIPIRLAHRVRALRNLPFIVVSNPHISRIYSNYLHSLETLLPFYGRPITTIAEETQFTDALADLVQTHTNTIPVLARGFLECKKYFTPDSVTQFLDEHLRARIGTRLVAEQHIALHLSSQPHTSSTTQPPSSYIGIIDTSLRPATVITSCSEFVSELCELKYGVRPSVTISGNPSVTIAQIPNHLEYILTELLKNAFRATVENGKEREAVEITIATSLAEKDIPNSNDASPSPEGGSGNALDETLTIRIRDRGGGIAPVHLPHIWTYSFTTFKDEIRGGTRISTPYGTAASSNISPIYSPATTNAMDALNTISASGLGGPESSSIAGLGYGLPLSRAYAEYFGGSIRLQSQWGWGTDVYLRLKGLRGF